MKTEISPVVLDQIRRQYHATKGRTARKAVVQSAADHYGMSYSNMNRKLELKLRKRSISKTDEENIAEKNRLGKAVWDFKEMHSKDDKPCSMRGAYRYLQTTGQVPGWFTEKMCYDAIERQCLKSLSTRSYIRFERDHAHSSFQMDFTKSNFLKYAGNNTIVMTDGRWSRGEDDLYVWIGGAIDDRTRVMYYEYILTPGENATMAQQFIIRAMEEKPGMMLLQGMPREIYVDRGPGFEARSTGDGLMRLGIKHIHGDDFRDARGISTGQTNKQARGKIEKMNSYVKSDFEQSLHLTYRAGHKFSLSDLNALLREWCELQNQCEHPEHANEGKWNVFNESLKSCQYPPANALAKFAKPILTKVSRRLIRVAKNEYYMAPAFIGEGERVEVSKRQNDCFVIWKDSEIKLIPQQSPYHPAVDTRKDTRRQILAEQLEKDDDKFEGLQLKDRFNTELGAITAGELSLANLDPETKQELRGFFGEIRSLADIKECADQVKMQILIPRGVSKNVESRVPNMLAHPKVIQYNPQIQ